MITRLFTRAALHEHADPAQRLLGIAELPPQSEELAQVLVQDPEPAVRAAAAQRCAAIGALVNALDSETDAGVRAALESALSRALVDTEEDATAIELLQADRLNDTIRAEVARHCSNAERRRLAITTLRDEAALVELAIGADLAETRLAAAERVHSPAALEKLDEAARNKDHGVYRLVHQRLEAIRTREDQTREADAILAQLDALVEKAGPILTEVVELNRRWQALDMRADAQRSARCEALRHLIQSRMDREQEEQRAQARFKAQMKDWLGGLAAPADTVALGVLRERLDTLREEAQTRTDAAATTELDAAQARIEQWAQALSALAAAEALVLEAEQLAAGTYIDNAKLPERWQALSREIRTPDLTRRFEAALIVIEQRRIAHVQAAQQEAGAIRQRLHALLHTAEQALTAGQLREARAAADEIKPLRAAAGTLPKPTLSRLGRLQQQLIELERWQSFGQQSARVQLCERAEAAAALTDPRQIAQEVQTLRNEWKALDQQYAGVPKALWERFDRACEKAYAPAARYFSELSAQRKEARKQREEFIAATATHAPTLLGEPRDWRAIERWLRETEQAWREKQLGSLDAPTWKRLDTKFKAALAPLRDALGSARDEAKTVRQALIDDATALLDQAMDRETPSKVKAIQARWQEHAKTLNLAQRDERVLWEKFRAACDAVFKARENKRQEADGRKQEERRALEDLITALEQLARTTDRSEQEIRRSLRDLQEQWRKQSLALAQAARALEPRFRKAKTEVENALGTRARSQHAAIWETLAAKERLCETLDGAVQAGGTPDITPEAIAEQWAQLPALPAAIEKKIQTRRDAALAALADPTTADSYRAQLAKSLAARREGLLELELLLGLESPADLQQQRLALQVKQLRDRFKSAITTGPESANERLSDWCAQPGVIESADRQRADRVFAAIKLRRS